jgi:hypothetical protein
MKTICHNGIPLHLLSRLDMGALRSETEREGIAVFCILNGAGDV